MFFLHQILLYGNCFSFVHTCTGFFLWYCCVKGDMYFQIITRGLRLTENICYKNVRKPCFSLLSLHYCWEYVLKCFSFFLDCTSTCTLRYWRSHRLKPKIFQCIACLWCIIILSNTYKQISWMMYIVFQKRKQFIYSCLSGVKVFYIKIWIKPFVAFKLRHYVIGNYVIVSNVCLCNINVKKIVMIKRSRNFTTSEAMGIYNLLE